MMGNDELYETWKRARSSSEVPEGFADAVMGSVLALTTRRRRASLREFLVRLVSSKPGRVAACLFAGVVCVFRMTQVLSVFLDVHH